MRFKRDSSRRRFGLWLLLFASVVWHGCGGATDPVADEKPDATTPLPARLEGGVVSDAGTPLENVALRLVHAGGALEMVSATNGSFAFDNAPTDAPLTLEAKADGYEPFTQDIPALKAGETRRTTLTLKTIPKDPPVPTGTEVGQRAPDFTLPEMNGKTVTLGDYRGKSAVLLTFHRGKF